jgi:ERCC4-type nuclease
MIVANQCSDQCDTQGASANPKDAGRPAHVLRVDFSERNAALVDLARECGEFDVRMDRLDVGDYCVDGGVVIERKTYLDFAMSLADGRSFHRRRLSQEVRIVPSCSSKVPSLRECPTFIRTR